MNIDLLLLNLTLSIFTPRPFKVIANEQAKRRCEACEVASLTLCEVLQQVEKFSIVLLKVEILVGTNESMCFDV